MVSKNRTGLWIEKKKYIYEKKTGNYWLALKSE